MNTVFLEEFTNNTIIKKYLEEIEGLYTDREKTLFNTVYKPMIEEKPTIGAPFLSVIIRTQGKREEGLRESLLCMYAQSNQDFEIILIGHNINQNQNGIIEKILDSQDADFRKKIRYFKLDSETRTAPLNYGFAHAKGKYVSVFDDDDILFENWVSAFADSAEVNDGRILHSFAFSQEWQNVKKLGYRSETAPLSNYCVSFDLLNQMIVNRCPFMTLAFPTNLFQKLGIIFNENLSVTEDWDYFMRLSFICGVSDICEPTAIYRFWKNIETSATLHAHDDWKETYNSIQKGFDEMSIILPPNNVSRIISLINSTDNSSHLLEGNVLYSKFYYSKGSAFCDCNCIRAASLKLYPEFDTWFLFNEKSNDLTAMRFDLCEEGLFLLDKIEIIVWFTNGEKYEVNMADCTHNGVKYIDSVLFLHEDPEIVWEWKDARQVDVVHISGSISKNLQRTRLLDRLESIFMVKDKKKKRLLTRKGYF